MKLSDVVTKFNNQAYAEAWQPGVSGLRVEKIISLIGSKKRVLDVGCYDGTIAKQIEASGNEVVGIDIAKKAVEMANKKGINAFVCNVEEDNLPSKIGKFDVVVAGELIEHIFDPDSFLKKLSSVLKSDGSLILTTPNLSGLGSRLSLLRGELPWMIENDILPGKSGHIRYFTPTELKKLLDRQGFKNVEFTTDYVGINNLKIPFFDKLFPQLGRIIIVKVSK